MRYAFEIKPHANARYALSMNKLALLECQCLLQAIGVHASVALEILAGTRFVVVECEPLGDMEWKFLSNQSGVSLAAAMEGDYLKLLQRHQPAYMPEDLAQVLKYKGKTNTDFTLFMLHCAKAASAFARSTGPLTILDPVCGRGTTLFCALQEGNNPVGIEITKYDVHETDTYFKRYLQYHRYKHKREVLSATLPQGGHAEEIRYQLANDADAYKTGDGRTLRLLLGDTAQADRMLAKESCHLLIADLPYGVQHAPKGAQGKSPLEQLIRGAFPAYRAVLRQGGAVAIAFNTYTLSREAVSRAMEDAGLHVLASPPYDDFSHWVEQAVNRDMVVAVKP